MILVIFSHALSCIGSCFLPLLRQAYFEHEVYDLCFDLFAKICLFYMEEYKES